MARKIVRDIEAKKTVRTFSDERSTERMHKKTASKAKQSPHILDISQESIVNQSISLTSDVTDIHAKKTDPGVLVVQKRKTPSIFLQLSWIGILGMFIVFLLNAAQGYANGQKLFTKIADSAKQGYGQLIEGGQQVKRQDIDAAQSVFEQAYGQFQSAQEQIWFMRNEPTLSKYTAVLDSGKLLADSGKSMIAIMQRMKSVPDLFAENMNHVVDIRSAPSKTALSELQGIYPDITQIHKNIMTTLQNFTNVSHDVPQQYKAVFTHGIALLASSEKLLGQLLVIIPGLEEMMGNGKPHRTLILLQNNDEVRATGGFIGSFINLQMENGHVTSLKLEDVYDMDGQFKERIEPPEELRRLTDRWFFRDSNTSPDFKTSGERALWFYAKERGETADTVMAVNQDILGKILGITGPIEMPGLAAPLTTDNYRETLTYMVETKRSGAADPKKILKDLMPLVQKRLFQSTHMAQFQQLLLEEIVQKNVVGYSRNPLVEVLFETIGMDGVFKPEIRGEDSLAVIASSFSANKSDAYIKQDLAHDTIIERDGDVYNQLTIKRTHLWSGATEQKWRQLLKPFKFTDFQASFLNIFGKGDNNVAMRVYVPSGAELISSDYIPVENIKTVRDPDLKRSYFTFDMTTKAGETSIAKLRYKLPFSMNNMMANTYTLNVQKQLGARVSNFTKHLFFGDFMAFAQAYPSDFVMQEDGSLTIGKPLNKDQRLSVLMTRDSLKK